MQQTSLDAFSIKFIHSPPDVVIPFLINKIYASYIKEFFLP